MHSRPVRRDGQQVRVIATALAERQDQLLLTQLARGPFAGFWLPPSATPDSGTVEATVYRMLPERTGFPVAFQQLISVVEEAKIGVLALRFVFQVTVDEQIGQPDGVEIAQARWFSRTAVSEILTERDIVPNLGVLSLVRAWADNRTLRPHELLTDDAQCPCGSGYGFRGCCGWDAK